MLRTPGKTPGCQSNHPPTHFSMDTYRWDRRPLLLFAPDARDPAYRTQKDLLDPAASALAERDIAMIEIIGDHASADGVGIAVSDAAAVRNHYQAAAGSFTIILVGKDGTEKLRSDSPLDPKQLMELIDSMPMRQQESGNRGD